MEFQCQNCETTITQNFCSQCGQKKYKRIDRKYIWDEIQYTTIHTNKGFLYSVKNIFKNPGKTAKEFIAGNRINHYKPISFAFIVSGISAFLSYKVIGLDHILKEFYASQNQKLTSNLMNDLMATLTSYSAFMMLSFIPILALCSKIVLRKWGQNYYEHVVMNAFGLSFYTLFSIVFIYPFYFFLKNDPQLIMSITFYIYFLMPIMMFWFYKNFYIEKKYTTIMLRVLLKFVLLVFSFFLIVISILIGYLIILGPAAVNQLNAK